MYIPVKPLYNSSFMLSRQVCIAEVEEIVPVGALSPEERRVATEMVGLAPKMRILPKQKWGYP